MASEKMNILFYIGTLEGGGAERVLIELLKNLNREKYRLFIVLNRPGGFFFDQIPEDVKIIDRSDAYKSHVQWFGRYFGLSGTIKQEKIDLVMSFLPGANRSLMRSIFFTDRSVKFVLNEQNNPAHLPQKNIPGWKQSVMDREARWLYPKADSVIVSCHGLREHFMSEWNLPESLVHTVHNPIDIKKIERLSRESINRAFNPGDGEYTLVAAGRLTAQKGYPEMLQVIQQVQEELPVKLFILGEGPERKNIETRIAELGLQQQVHLVGFISNPWAWLNRADLYLSTSKYEGFHLTVAEAMACGTPPVVTDCDYGPREIIEQGVNGFLFPVGDTHVMADKIVELLKDRDTRDRVSVNARKRAEKFDISLIIQKYEQMFDSLINHSK